MDDDAIRTLVGRLSRPDRSGGDVIECAAILAEGADSAEVLAWIIAHDGQPERLAPAPASGGLHGARLRNSGGQQASAPQRYVLPPGALS